MTLSASDPWRLSTDNPVLRTELSPSWRRLLLQHRLCPLRRWRTHGRAAPADAARHPRRRVPRLVRCGSASVGLLTTDDFAQDPASSRISQAVERVHLSTLASPVR